MGLCNCGKCEPEQLSLVEQLELPLEQRVRELEARVDRLERVQERRRCDDLPEEDQGAWRYVPGETPGTGGLVRDEQAQKVLDAERKAGLNGTGRELGVK